MASKQATDKKAKRLVAEALDGGAWKVALTSGGVTFRFLVEKSRDKAERLAEALGAVGYKDTAVSPIGVEWYQERSRRTQENYIVRGHWACPIPFDEFVAGHLRAVLAVLRAHPQHASELTTNLQWYAERAAQCYLNGEALTAQDSLTTFFALLDEWLEGVA